MPRSTSLMSKSPFRLPAGAPLMTPNLHAGSREFHGNLTNTKEIQ